MSLQIKLADGLHMPIITCDQCKRQIDDARLGTAYWIREQPEVYFLHKRCDSAITFNPDTVISQVPIDLEEAYTEELSQFLVCLRNNTINEKAPTDQKGT